MVRSSADALPQGISFAAIMDHAVGRVRVSGYVDIVEPLLSRPRSSQKIRLGLIEVFILVVDPIHAEEYGLLNIA
jgi:hypothetical protein